MDPDRIKIASIVALQPIGRMSNKISLLMLKLFESGIRINRGLTLQLQTDERPEMSDLSFHGAPRPPHRTFQYGSAAHFPIQGNLISFPNVLFVFGVIRKRKK